ncbi:amphi-Trp domain-containing protein [Candidatus Halobonum tyrrellensis]|uniref:Amphi-Trp domain-containing protein n=1 Tax=Candidatus Halobonum tyrrellensis G22 TaxID=1324957 RepID=V4HG18_9EURY|nr:amphi-Trp domain-containing protein [Candidatus Halobonum tyrrellensis]ESP89063.1 hypothetical protein K933_05648 [Candidatus Halobonum tyrrellensis G22]
MAEKTISEDEVTREEAADRLEALATELREGDCNVQVGNKTVTVQPPSSIAYEVGVRESSSILRGSRESVTVKMDWKPE